MDSCQASLVGCDHWILLPDVVRGLPPLDGTRGDGSSAPLTSQSLPSILTVEEEPSYLSPACCFCFLQLITWEFCCPSETWGRFRNKASLYSACGPFPAGKVDQAGMRVYRFVATPPCPCPSLSSRIHLGENPGAFFFPFLEDKTQRSPCPPVPQALQNPWTLVPCPALQLAYQPLSALMKTHSRGRSLMLSKASFA